MVLWDLRVAGLRSNSGAFIIHWSHVTSDKYLATGFLILHKDYTKFIMPAEIMSSAQINIIHRFIWIIRKLFIPNSDDPVFDMIRWRIEWISFRGLHRWNPFNLSSSHIKNWIIWIRNERIADYLDEFANDVNSGRTHNSDRHYEFCVTLV